jgi:ribosomal protein S18 acetylase RimI-like enzyme
LKAAPSRSRAATVIRAAEPEDSGPAADLIYLPMEQLADYLFGADDPARAREVLGHLFAQRQNRFSYEFSHVLESEDGILGLLLAYPASILGQLSMPMAKQLRELIGVRGMFRLLRRSVPLMRLKETEPDEFYVYTLAIEPEFQNNGLGKRLMAHAEALALEHGLRKCSLGVTMNNDRALNFYERLGYKVVDTVPVPHLEQRIGYPGYFRMVKPVRAV